MKTTLDEMDLLRDDVQNALFECAQTAIDSLLPNSKAIEPADLVNEVNLTLLGAGKSPPFSSRQEFISWAKRLISIQVAFRSRRYPSKHGGGRVHLVPLTGVARSTGKDQDVLQLALELRDALEKLHALDPRLAEVVELRYFQGYSMGETAEKMGLTPAEVKRLWRQAKLELMHLLMPATQEGTREDTSIVLPLVDYQLIDKINRNPELLHSLNWRVFEKLIAELLSTSGYDVELMAGTKDGGVDVVAFKKDTHFGVQKYLVQAKRWSSSVGVEPVRELLFIGSEMGASKVCMATTSKFTQGAWKLGGRYPWQLELRDFQGIRDWVQRSSKLSKIEG